MIAAASGLSHSLPAVIGAAVGIFGVFVGIAKVGDKAGAFEEHLKTQDDALAKQAETLAKQDQVLDEQNIALAELRAELKALHDQN